MLLYHFHLNFILFVHTGHANFDFNRSSILQNVVFSFKKGSNGRIHSSSDSHHLIKNLTRVKKVGHTSVWHLLMNLKNNYLLKKLLSGLIKNVRILIFTMLYFSKKNNEKHLEIPLFYTCIPKILMI